MRLYVEGQNQLVARLAVSTALNESSFGFLTPSKVPNFNNCFSIKKGFAAGFLLEKVTTAGFVLQVCDTTTSLKCFKRVKCSSNCLVVSACIC